MIEAGILRSDESIHCDTVLVSNGHHSVGGNLYSVKLYAFRFDVAARLPHKSREAGGGSEGVKFQEMIACLLSSIESFNTPCIN